MAKDPAFLFYSADFITGTFTMTDEQVGKYIRLLCLQHEKYELNEKDMMFICKSYDEDIFGKFVKTEDGMYHNVRLREEAEKRQKYSESRSNNRKSGLIPTYENDDMKNICLTCVNHMVNGNINENINSICSKCFNKSKYKKIKAKPEFKIPDMREVESYFIENGYSKESAEKFFKYYTTGDWKDRDGNKVKNWKQKAQSVWFKPENAKSIYNTSINPHAPSPR